MDNKNIVFSEKEITDIVSPIANAPLSGYNSIQKNRQVQMLPFRKLMLLINEKSLIGSDEESGAGLLPPVTPSDEGKFLRVIGGEWKAEHIPLAENEDF